MAIDVGQEEIISLEEAARKLGVSYYTVRRWTRDGICGVLLECVPVGTRKTKTSVEALNRFTELLRQSRLEASGK